MGAQAPRRWYRAARGWLAVLASSTLARAEPGQQPGEQLDPEATREVVGLLLNVLGLAVVVVILLLVLGLPARSWLRQRRAHRDVDDEP